MRDTHFEAFRFRRFGPMIGSERRARKEMRAAGKEPKMAQGPGVSSKGPSRADLEAALDQVVDTLDEALNPRLSREEVVEKLADLRDQIAPDDEEDEDDDEDDED